MRGKNNVNSLMVATCLTICSAQVLDLKMFFFHNKHDALYKRNIII